MSENTNSKAQKLNQKKKPKIHFGSHSQHIQKVFKSLKGGKQVKAKDEIPQLIKEIQQNKPRPGTNLLAEEGPTVHKLFKYLPISHKTKAALAGANYKFLTEIQRASLPFALAGRDILGAAKTGSGKTLAFIVPVLEKLYRERWTPQDGIGALIISPTRELALQIFEVLRKVGCAHDFSAGLVIGGKSVQSEQSRILGMNILVCTPGRLLQHFDETPGFNCDNLQILVLDEADRCMDMGFEKSMNAIVDNLPQTRQTLLFSATQTKSVKTLARLSLNDPEYVAVHEKSQTVTPQKLEQFVMTVDLPEKLSIFYSFLRTHTKAKIVAFFSSCKQVKFVYEAFCKMRPGMSVMCLHGKMKQMKRLALFNTFCSKDDGAVLLCTDIAARGLDFPAVDWVVQVDCPEDTDTYVHRVGRTARYLAGGKALLLLLPSEEKFLERLEAKKVPYTQIQANQEKTQDISVTLQGLMLQDTEMKFLGQKACVAYIKSLYLQNDKEVFDVHSLPIAAFALSLGLPGTPKISFIHKAAPPPLPSTTDNIQAPRPTKDGNKEKEKQETPDGRASGSESGSGSDEETFADLKNRKKKKSGTEAPDTIQRLFKKKNQGVLSEHYTKLVDQESESDEEEDILVVRRRIEPLPEVEGPAPKTDKAKPAPRKLRITHTGEAVVAGVRTEFDDDGAAKAPFEIMAQEEQEKALAGLRASDRAAAHVAQLRAELAQADRADRLTLKARLKEKRLKKKMKPQEKENGEGFSVVLGGPTLGSGEEEDETLDIDLGESDSDAAAEGAVVPAVSLSESSGEDEPSVPAQKKGEKEKEKKQHSQGTKRKSKAGASGKKKKLRAE